MDLKPFNPNQFIKGSQDYNPKVSSIITSGNPDVISGESFIMAANAQIAAPAVKKKETKKKDELAAPSTAVAQPNFIQTNMSYMTAYADTNQQLDDVISELNALGQSTMADLIAIKSSKTIKNKYGLVNELTATAVSIVNGKIQAIKEKNKTINDVNSIELRREKELKLDAAKEDDASRISSLYNAFINMPVGTYGGRPSLGPTIQDITVAGGLANAGLNSVPIGSDQMAWEQSLNAAENRMLLEAKGTIETIVIYNQETGDRWFDVVDKVTGQSVPNVERPDATYIWDLDINVKGNYAKDSNRNTIYPLRVIGMPDMSKF